jgi:hypothetical protein
MKSLEPTNHRISNSLFDAINRVRNGILESTVATEGAVDKAHFCATHVEHALLGQGVCISEQHAEPDENGDIAWYSVEFPSGIQRVNTSNLKITEGKSHSHGKKMAEEEEVAEEENVEEEQILEYGEPSKYNSMKRDVGVYSHPAPSGKRDVGVYSHPAPSGKRDVGVYSHPSAAATPAPKTNSGMKTKDQTVPKHQLVKHLIGTNMDPRYSKPNNSPDMKTKTEGNDGNLANNAKPYDKVTHGDVITGRLGKDEMGGKKKKVTAEARSTGTVFDKPKDNPLTKDIKSAFNKKQVPTGTVYTRKPPAKVKESVTQTIINHNDFVLEVTDNPSYSDYLKALQSMVGQSNEEIQQEIVTIATEAFNENYTDIIIESQTKKIFESKFEDIRMSGGKVLGENYMVDSGEPYVEYTVEKDGKAIQYVHLGTIKTV